MLERIFSPEYFETSLPSPRVPVMVNWRNIPITVRREKALVHSGKERPTRELREEQSRKLRETMVRLGESLLRSRGIELPATSVDHQRIAQIEAYKDLIRSKTRDLEKWREFRDRATTQGILKQAQFRRQMIAGMENQLERYKEELRRLHPSPAHSGRVPPSKQPDQRT